MASFLTQSATICTDYTHIIQGFPLLILAFLFYHFAQTHSPLVGGCGISSLGFNEQFGIHFSRSLFLSPHFNRFQSTFTHFLYAKHLFFAEGRPYYNENTSSTSHLRMYDSHEHNPAPTQLGSRGDWDVHGDIFHFIFPVRFFHFQHHLLVLSYRIVGAVAVSSTCIYLLLFSRILFLLSHLL